MPLCENHEPQVRLTPSAGISRFVNQLAYRCPAMRSIWRIGELADRDAMDSPRPFDWELVAFADLATLHYLRNAADLHRADVLLRLVTDGDRFEIAWGALERSGSLVSWGWRRATKVEAYYSEARWARPAEAGDVERRRRRAACVWHSAPVSASQPGLRNQHHSPE
jgi:hypothetical protein